MKVIRIFVLLLAAAVLLSACNGEKIKQLEKDKKNLQTAKQQLELRVRSQGEDIKKKDSAILRLKSRVVDSTALIRAYIEAEKDSMEKRRAVSVRAGLDKLDFSKIPFADSASDVCIHCVTEYLIVETNQDNYSPIWDAHDTIIEKALPLFGSSVHMLVESALATPKFMKFIYGSKGEVFKDVIENLSPDQKAGLVLQAQFNLEILTMQYDSSLVADCDAYLKKYARTNNWAYDSPEYTALKKHPDVDVHRYLKKWRLMHKTGGQQEIVDFYVNKLLPLIISSAGV